MSVAGQKEILKQKHVLRLFEDQLDYTYLGHWKDHEDTGLSLSLSYDIVTQGHGGTMAVISKEGEGATLVLTLPEGEG